MKPTRRKKDIPTTTQEAPFFQKKKTADLPEPARPFFAGPGPLLQKQDDPGNKDPNAPAPGTKDPTTAPLPQFTFTDKFQEFGRFDARYTPVGPVPAQGTLDIYLWVHIGYEDFSTKRMKKDPYKNIRFTQEQLKDFAWTSEEKEKFESDFMTSVQDQWSGRFKFHLVDPAFAEYRTGVQVSVITVDDPKLAHMKINALKVPKGAPRFRSFVSGNEATLEKRDPSEPQKSKTTPYDMVRQIGSFGFDRHDLTPDLISQISEVASFLKSDPNPDHWSLSFSGRASTQGKKSYNEKLASKRAEAVRLELFRQVGWKDEEVANYITFDKGEEHATGEAKFRRVDITVNKSSSVGSGKEVEQNVAAHEAGHMFGLGDEYIRETNLLKDEEAKFLGDKPSHYEAVDKYIGKQEANELLINQTDSIMSVGNTVKKGHYLTFLLALNKLTGRDPEKKNWKVE